MANDRPWLLFVGCEDWSTPIGCRGRKRRPPSYAGAQLSCVIEANFPGLDEDRIENLSIEFAHRLFMKHRRALRVPS